jgi:hypothetical protein
MARTQFLNERVAEGASFFALGGRPEAGRSDARRGRQGAVSAPLAAEQAAIRCRLAREIASAVLAVPVEEIARPTRSIAETCQARHLAIYLAHVVFQVPLSAIAVGFGRDRTSVAYAIRRVEDARDEAGFERLVTRMERLADACLELSGRGDFA